MLQLNPLQLFKTLLTKHGSVWCSCCGKRENFASANSHLLSENLSQKFPVILHYRDAGLLIDRRDSKWIHYRLSPHMPVWAAAVIEQAYLCQRDDILQLSQQAERDNVTTNGKPICI